MTYLAALRVHFAGSFQANPSTVNNEPGHFDDARFQRRFQEPFSGSGDPNNWNPRGDGAWRLVGCSVTSAWHGDGTPAGAGDPLLAALVADSGDRVSAKIADLDPEQQMVSMIFGLEVRIADASGATLVGGRFTPAAFIDIWPRVPGRGGLELFSAAYQSVLTDLEWGDVSGSPLLSELQAAASDGLLSIRFVVDGMNADPSSDTFTLGRIVGTIGVASAAEPQHFVAGRALNPRGLRSPSFNYAAAVVDTQLGKVHCDLGNAIQAASSGGPLVPVGPLSLACLLPRRPPLVLGTIDYQPGEDWYRQTAGVVSLPADRALTHEELVTIHDAPLAIMAGEAVALAEASDGVHVRADRYVYRLDPGDVAQVSVYATHFGRRFAGVQIAARREPSLFGPSAPRVGTPHKAIEFPALVTTDSHGVAELPIRASDPGRPRGFLDGQLYAVVPAHAGTTGPPANPSEYVSLLVWSAFRGGDPLTWFGDVQPIFQQYANLYPVMGTFVNLADYDDVCANRTLLQLAFGLDPSDPNSMPVTRDLSEAKRAAIRRWLNDVGPDGKPLKGTPPPHLAAPSLAEPVAEEGPSAGMDKVSATARLEAARRAAEESQP